MVPWGPTSSVTWSLRNHLARCSKTPGPQGTRICVRMVPRGSTPQATWSLVHHPRRRPRRPGHGGTRTRAKLVPRGPSSREIWSLVLQLARFRRRRAAGVVTRGPDSAPGWSPEDQVRPSTWSQGDHPHHARRSRAEKSPHRNRHIEITTRITTEITSRRGYPHAGAAGRLLT